MQREGERDVQGGSEVQSERGAERHGGVQRKRETDLDRCRERGRAAQAERERESDRDVQRGREVQKEREREGREVQRARERCAETERERGVQGQRKRESHSGERARKRRADTETATQRCRESREREGCRLHNYSRIPRAKKGGYTQRWVYQFSHKKPVGTYPAREVGTPRFFHFLPRRCKKGR